MQKHTFVSNLRQRYGDALGFRSKSAYFFIFLFFLNFKKYIYFLYISCSARFGKKIKKCQPDGLALNQ